MPSCKMTVQQEPVQSARIEFNITLPPINLWSVGLRKNRMFVHLYTSPSCTNCAPVKQRLEQAGIQYEQRDISDNSFKEELFKQGVRAVPYLHAENQAGSEYKALGSGINIKSLQSFLES